jgi:uncharacterized protein YqhQ
MNMVFVVLIAMWRTYPKAYLISLLAMIPVSLFVYWEVWYRYGFWVMIGVSFVLSLVGGLLSRLLMKRQDQAKYAVALLEEMGRMERKAKS